MTTHELHQKEIQRLERLLECEAIAVRSYNEAARNAETEQGADFFRQRAKAAKKRGNKISAELEKLYEKKTTP